MAQKIIVDTDTVQDAWEQSFHKHLNNKTKVREKAAAAAASREAQERARAAKIAERARRIRANKKRKAVAHLALSAAIVIGLYSAYTADLISPMLAFPLAVLGTIYFGWCMNTAVQSFRRKPRRS